GSSPRAASPAPRCASSTPPAATTSGWSAPRWASSAVCASPRRRPSSSPPRPAMHIPDGFIDLPTSAAAAAIAAPTVVLATRRAGRQLAEREVPVAGLVVAYLVVAQLLVFPVGLGTGAHLLGTGLALVLVGPWVAHAC